MQSRGVSVILPACDEAATIDGVVRGCLRHTPGLLEVLVVDDGSTDRTGELAERAGARVVRLARNGGKGAAVRKGLELARGDVLVFLDADGQDAPEQIPILLAALEPGTAMVIGSRFLGDFEKGAITRVNRTGTQFLTAVLNALFRTRLTDPNAGFRAVRRSAVQSCVVSATHYDIEVDLVLGLLARGERVAEVPIGRRARLHGATGLSPLVDGTRILWRIVSHRLRAFRVWRRTGSSR